VGVYSEYLDKGMSFDDLQAERKVQLDRIAQHRSRDVLVYAANLSPQFRSPISVDYSDLLPINDQLDNLDGQALDFILETPGGSGEIAEDIVRLLRGKYNDVATIVPGAAKSAGTLIVMSADDILMEPASALGPIDAQISWQGKVFSAEALLEGINRIKKEVTESGQLNLAYLPILQQISPGELENARNALNFARALVTDWLARYKFKNWKTHSSTGDPVTDAERRQRADEIAAGLSNHAHWKTHGRSIKITDLEAMRLKITDYTQDATLADAIRRYHTLLQMTFGTNCYKLIETTTSQIYRFAAPPTPRPSDAPIAPPTPAKAAAANLDVQCNNCGANLRVQASFNKKQPLEEGSLPWPENDKLECPTCGTEVDLADARRQIEAQVGEAVVT
jgi:hypothetical protein